MQDVLNTHPTQRPPVADLLADLDSAQRWLDGALQNWSQETGVPQNRVLLTEADLDKLRSLRADLASLLRPADRQIAHVEVARADIEKRSHRSRANVHSRTRSRPTSSKSAIRSIVSLGFERNLPSQLIRC